MYFSPNTGQHYDYYRCERKFIEIYDKNDHLIGYISGTTQQILLKFKPDLSFIVIYSS